jgi:hypothetical protein
LFVNHFKDDILYVRKIEIKIYNLNSARYEHIL